MSRLFLFRHAKAAWAEPGMRDFDRKLSDDGIEEAKKMGIALHANALLPDHIICSSAVRARETFDAANYNGIWTNRVTYTENL